MNDDSQYFELSETESRQSWGRLAIWGGWIALFALIVSTGVHAVSLVTDRMGEVAGILDMIRVASPVLVELMAAIVAVGFAAHRWRGLQKKLGLAVELLWLAFAAANLVTAFASEGLAAGAQLPGLLALWVDYGLPVSALVAGALFYAMLRSDPESQRQAELAATFEAHRMAQFAARRAVLLSPQMANVLRQQGWLSVISDLERAGYTDEQIRHMFRAVPELMTATSPAADDQRDPPDSAPAVPLTDLRRPTALNGETVNFPTRPDGR